MGAVRISAIGRGDADEVFADVAARQGDHTQHVILTGVDVDTVAEELTAVPAWRDRLLVARHEGTVVGAVLPEVDESMRRVWWYGPWAADEDVARRLLESATRVTSDLWDEEEFSPDARNERVARLAQERGCTAGTPSSVLVLATTDDLPPIGTPRTAPLADEHRDAVAALHDELFPGTHTTGDRLVGDDEGVLRVAVVDDEVVGYVAVELQADGSVYVDYLGVATPHRRDGLARALLTEALRGAFPGHRAHLTVRLDAEGARALYLGLGFVEERVAVPWRRGFDLG